MPNRAPYKTPGTFHDPYFNLSIPESRPGAAVGSRREAGKVASVKSFLGCRVSEFKDLPSFGSRLRRCLAPSLALYCVLTILPRCRTSQGPKDPPHLDAGSPRAPSARDKTLGEFAYDHSISMCNFCRKPRPVSRLVKLRRALSMAPPRRTSAPVAGRPVVAPDRSCAVR